MASPTPTAVSVRLRPLYLAFLLGGFALWVPIEKLFMAEIGFDPASMGVMAAVYALVVPVLEVPSGILADRWSRRGVLLLAYGAVLASVAVFAVAEDVTTYLIGAALLGVFLAMQSGTLEAMVYDVLVEETGDDTAFERTIGRFRAVESAALATSAIGGGVVAALTSPRMSYVATLPVLVLSIVAMSRFREATPTADEERQPLRDQVRTTYRTVLSRGALRPIVALMVLDAVLVQLLIEFGPLWMVVLGAPVLLHGAQWAGLTGALGVGGLVAGRLHLDCRSTLTALGVLALAAAATLVAVTQPLVVIAAQVALLLVAMVLGIRLTGLLHAAIPSAIRAGVASGVSTVTWMAFLPLSLGLGFAVDRIGIASGGWIVLAVTAALVVGASSLARPAATCRTEPAGGEVVEPVARPVEVGAAA